MWSICWNQMRIDPKGTVADWPALLVRRTSSFECSARVVIAGCPSNRGPDVFQEFSFRRISVFMRLTHTPPTCFFRVIAEGRLGIRHGSSGDRRWSSFVQISQWLSRQMTANLGRLAFVGSMRARSTRRGSRGTGGWHFGFSEALPSRKRAESDFLTVHTTCLRSPPRSLWAL